MIEKGSDLFVKTRRQAEKQRNGGDYSKAAKSFLKASSIAMKSLKNGYLANLMKIEYYTALVQVPGALTLSNVKGLLRSINDTLTMRIDDRLPAQFEPIQDFFKAIQFALEGDTTGIEEQISILKEKTEKVRPNYINSLTHLIIEVCIIRAQIKRKRRALDEKAIAKSLESLSDCIRRHRDAPELPQDIQSLLNDLLRELNALAKEQKLLSSEKLDDQILAKYEHLLKGKSLGLSLKMLINLVSDIESKISLDMSRISEDRERRNVVINYILFCIVVVMVSLLLGKVVNTFFGTISSNNSALV